MLDDFIDPVVTTTSVALTIPNLSRAATSIAFGSFVSLWISNCKDVLAPRTKSISLTILSCWPEDDWNSARERTITVAHMALAASKTVAKIAHPGTSRKPLIAGISKSRATSTAWTEVIDCASGPLLGRLFNHSVVPILCKNHLHLRVRLPNHRRNLWLGIMPTR